MGEGEERITVSTWGLFMPLYAGLLSQEEATELVTKHLTDRRQFYTRFPAPSLSLREPSYTSDDLWRGPTWIAVNWFIEKGLRNYGFNDVARVLRERTHALINTSGFREFYDPRTGKGHGAEEFTWGGLVLDMAL
jgi:glycogen debranching enzyme